MTRKTYVIDTNVLLFDPGSLTSFDEHLVIIPLVVFEELDKHKNRFDEVGRNARYISRYLDTIRSAGNLFEGVPLENGGILKVASLLDVDVNLPKELRNSSCDNTIIFHMLQLSKLDSNVKLVTKDINLRLKCDALGIKSEDYLKSSINKDIDDLYTGVDSLSLSDDQIEDLLTMDELLVESDKTLYPNQIIIVKNDQTRTSAIARCINQSDENCYKLVQVKPQSNVYGLNPRNKEQNFSLDLLLNPEIKLVTMIGAAGCGKTLLAIASALHQLKMPGAFVQLYERLVITRPIQPVGKDLGFLPGSLDEKLDPWISPIKDNINFLVKSKNHKARQRKSPHSDGKDSFLQLLQERGLLEIEAISYIRGRSIPNAFLIVDEAQNLSIHELKTICTRVGEGTKIVLTGDISQIDNNNVDIHTNALTYAIEKFKEQPLAGHITLLKGERSALATLSSQIL